MNLTLEPLTTSKLDEFRDLLGSKEFGGCFCAIWTNFGDDWVTRCADQAQPNFFLTKQNVETGRHTGFLVYQNNTLIGWTGSGPKSAFPFLKSKLGSRLSEFSDDVWSIGCLAVKKQFRGGGVGDHIVRSVLELAKASGANSVEAYPVRPFHEPRVFRGSFKMYDRIGFEEINSEKDGDHEILLMVKQLGASNES